MIWQRNKSFTPKWRASASYVTGANNFKVGVDGLTFDQERTTSRQHQALNYRLSNGVPNQLTMFINDFKFNNVTSSFATYAQNQTTLGRLTLQGGHALRSRQQLRAEQELGPDRFLPNQIVVPEARR